MGHKKNPHTIQGVGHEVPSSAAVLHEWVQGGDIHHMGHGSPVAISPCTSVRNWIKFNSIKF